jgi:RNA polymerase sigma-70 factor (ECF subfamily)
MDNGLFNFAEFKEGDGIAFARIYNDYEQQIRFQAIRFVGNHEGAGNLVTDTFVALWEGRQTINNEEHIRAFLYRVIRNKCINYLINKERKPDLSKPSLPGELKDVAGDSVLLESVIMRELRQQISRLTPSEQVVMTETLINGRSIAEIAAMQDKTKNNIEVIISNAKKKMTREILKTLLTASSLAEVLRGMGDFFVLVFMLFLKGK